MFVYDCVVETVYCHRASLHAPKSIYNVNCICYVNLTENWVEKGEGGNLLASHLGRSNNTPSHFTLKNPRISRKRSSLHTSQVDHKAEAYPSFCSMK